LLKDAEDGKVHQVATNANLPNAPLEGQGDYAVHPVLVVARAVDVKKEQRITLHYWGLLYRHGAGRYLHVPAITRSDPLYRLLCSVYPALDKRGFNLG